MTAPRALVEQIALYLGRPWKFNGLGEVSKWQWEIIDGAGKCLYFREDKNRFKITGHFPRNRTSPYHRDYKTIGVSMSRSPKDIAADISRRLIPHYTKAFEIAVQRYGEEKAHEERIAHITHLIKKASKGRCVDHDKRNPTIYFNDGQAKIWSDETITLEIRKLSTKQVIQILSLLLDEE